MKSKTTTATVEKETTTRKEPRAFFDRDNILWMLIGAAVMIVGFLLMAGGRNEDPNVFDESKVYSTTRITIAPILILAGFVIEIYALFRHPKKG
jgi:hypothetical protein